MAYYQKYKQNKYSNVRQTYNNITYDSKREAAKAMELDLRLRAKDIKSWKRQIKIEINFVKEKNGRWYVTGTPALELKAKGKEFRHFRNYFMDFVITNNDGSIEYCEIKGMETEIWKMKFFLSEMIFDEHPEIYLKVEKQYGNSIKHK